MLLQCARLDISPSPSILFHERTPAFNMTYWYFALFVRFRQRRLELLCKHLLLCCHDALRLFWWCVSLGPCRSAFTVCVESLLVCNVSTMAVSVPQMTSQSKAYLTDALHFPEPRSHHSHSL